VPHRHLVAAAFIAAIAVIALACGDASSPPAGAPPASGVESLAAVAPPSTPATSASPAVAPDQPELPSPNSVIAAATAAGGSRSPAAPEHAASDGAGSGVGSGDARARTSSGDEPQSGIAAVDTATPHVAVPGNETIVPLFTPTRTPTRTATATPTRTPAPGNAPSVGGCTMFPSDNAWNTDISGYPVHPNSQNFINNILSTGGTGRVHPDFGSNPDYGIPYIVVPPSQPMVPINFTDYGDESDPGPYPIPLNAPIEGGGDRHVLAVRQGECKLYELFNAWPQANRWDASSGAVWDLNSNALRPAGWTSADAAGLPVLAGLVRYDEVAAGAIRHAVRFSVRQSQRAYILPATHWASTSTDPNRPPMGLRLRLKATYDISGYTGQSRVVLEALKTYGMILADNGSNFYITGARDPRWNDDDLNQLKTIPGSAFEAVYTGPTVGP
jgi:hypothetical protein